jgi:hypothetical protein
MVAALRNLLAVVLTCSTVAGCTTSEPSSPTPPTMAALAAVLPGDAASAPAAVGCARSTWSCAQQQRFSAAETYARGRVGARSRLAAVFTDRSTGATWRLGDVARPGWTASTIKLAIATDLLARDRAGAINLTPVDRRDLAAMLNSSANGATNRLWRAYGGPDMLARFRQTFGMSTLRFVPGFTRTTYWGFVRCSTNDLASLMQHVLTRTDPADRSYLVQAVRGVAPNQQWGVWAAGAAERPGNKDGWSYELDPQGRHWVTNTVGFAGPGERYAIAVMYQLDPSSSLADGVHTVSDLVALLFGRPTPAPVTVPAPDG